MANGWLSVRGDSAPSTLTSEPTKRDPCLLAAPLSISVSQSCNSVSQIDRRDEGWNTSDGGAGGRRIQEPGPVLELFFNELFFEELWRVCSVAGGGACFGRRWGWGYFLSGKCDHLIGNHLMHLRRSCSASVYPVRRVSRIDGQEQEEEADEEETQWAASHCPTE